MNYQKLVQWTSGPVAIVAGLIASKLVTNTSFLGHAGLGKSQVAHAIVILGSFAVGAVVTYLGHHKTLDNINKVLTTFGTHEPVALPVPPQPVIEARLRAQLVNAGLKPEV